MKNGEVLNDIKPKPKEREKVKEKATLPRVNSGGKIEKNKPAAADLTELPPITPAPPNLNLFSPADSQPPPMMPQTRDTPPPGDLNSSNTDAARTSRRQRAQVSYAEPSLRDKMRRPGKELVAAVGANGKSAYVSRKNDSDKTDEHSTIQVKTEDDAEESSWKTLPIEKPHVPVEPSSPLGGKSSKSNEELPPTVITDRRRRSVQRLAEDASLGPQSGVSQSTIAALVAGSQKRLSRAREAAEARRLSGEGSSVYDFIDKSPPEEKESDSSKPNNHSRRHSSMSEIKGSSTKEAVLGLARSSSTSAVSRTIKTSGEREDGESGLSLSRGERMAARRRSMMI